MPKDRFETEIEGLFAQGGEFDDSEVFVARVSDRVAKLRRTERLVHSFAFTLGGLIAVLELAQANFGQAAAAWLQRLTGQLAAVHWTAPDPSVWGLVLGAVLLSVYVGNLLREN